MIMGFDVIPYTLVIQKWKKKQQKKKTVYMNQTISWNSFQACDMKLCFFSRLLDVRRRDWWERMVLKEFSDHAWRERISKGIVKLCDLMTDE